MTTATPLAPAPVRSHRFRLAETHASDLVSAACYRGTKNIGVVAVVVAELELGNIQRHVLGADLMERADHATLEDRPEALNRVRVHSADNVFFRAVANGSVRKLFPECVVSPHVIGGEQTDLVRDGFTNEAGQSLAVEMLYDPRNNIALALDCTNDADLAGAAATRTAIALIPMLIAGLSADIGFVHFDD